MKDIINNIMKFLGEIVFEIKDTCLWIKNKNKTKEEIEKETKIIDKQKNIIYSLTQSIQENKSNKKKGTVKNETPKQIKKNRSVSKRSTRK